MVEEKEPGQRENNQGREICGGNRNRNRSGGEAWRRQGTRPLRLNTWTQGSLEILARIREQEVEGLIHYFLGGTGGEAIS